jgi:hypothetical protein
MPFGFCRFGGGVVTEDRWRKVADVYGAAQDKTPSGRLPFVREVAAGDSDLRRQVESILSEDDQPHVLDTPLPVTAAEILDNSPVTSATLVGRYRIENLITMLLNWKSPR